MIDLIWQIYTVVESDIVITKENMRHYDGQRAGLR